ncbi:hypothetical protein [Streptomyces sp. NPDC086989]|uniref:hypothetical protein n=1 Tax=Streptomyces sp. NPDC086989 TaxID=3365764 RepID=UPI003829F344
MSARYAEIQKQAAHDLLDGKMLIQQENGVYRHLACGAPASWTRLTVITWPYNLLVAGSHGSFHFERQGDDTLDMLAWIRRVRVDPAHWAGKLVNGRHSVEEYDRDTLERLVNERVSEAVNDGWAPDGLREAVAEELLGDEWMDDEQNAKRLVSEFQHGMTYRSECSCGAAEDHDSYDSACRWQFYVHKQTSKDHKVSIRETGGFTFDDIFDWQTSQLDYHFIYQCYALKWAVARYDQLQNYGLGSYGALKAVAS